MTNQIILNKWFIILKYSGILSDDYQMAKDDYQMIINDSAIVPYDSHMN